jgi:MFS family permease
VQLLAGIACMVMIANLQYGWTLFVHPMREKYGWDRSAIQVAFTIFVLVETLVVPFEGWIVDRFGPKRVVLAGGVLVGLAWGLNSIADSLPLLYLGAALGGIGAGGVFGTCIGNALKWSLTGADSQPASPPPATASARPSPSSRSRGRSKPMATRRPSCGSASPKASSSAWRR